MGKETKTNACRILDKAKISGNKKVEILPMKDLLSITGYIRGGCSPVGMKKQFPTFVQEEARERESFIISAGRRGAQLVLSPTELVSFLRGKFTDCQEFYTDTFSKRKKDREYPRGGRKADSKRDA